MSTPLRELITSLSVDATSRDAFAANPARFLAEHGWADLDGEDVSTALGALVDEAPIEQAVRLSEVDTDGFDAVAGLEAAAAALAEAPAPTNGEVDELAPDPDMALDRPDEDDRDPSLGIDEDGDEPDLDDADGGPDGPDRLDVSDDELDTSTFRSPVDYEDDGEEAAEPAADAQPDTEALPDISLGDPTGGIDQGAGHESFIDTDDDGEAVDVPEPEDDDL
jgi:hypothetical protein